MSIIWAPLRPFGVDLFCLGRKFLVYNMVGRNLKIKYRRSIFGLLWTLISPVSMALVYYFVFKVTLKIQVPHYLAFILSGVLPWSFFSQSLIEGMESISGNWGLLTKVPIQPQVFPFVNVLTNLSTLALSIPVLLGAAILSGTPLGASCIFLPFLLFNLFLFAYFFALSLGILFVFFKDLRHLIGIVLQAWFYCTPVFYDESMIPEKLRWILSINPVASIFTGIHKVLIYGTWPTQIELVTLFVWTLGSLCLAALIQKNMARELVESL